MAPQRPTRHARLTQWSAIAFAGSVIVLMIATLRWPPNQDFAKLSLIVRAISQGQRPYADVVDMNYPGTYLVYTAGQAVFGTSYLAVRLQDLALMLVVMAGSWVFLKPISRTAAAVSVFLIPWWYYTAFYVAVNYQRDWLIAAAVLWAANLLIGPTRTWKVLGAGVLMGLAMMIRPTAVLPAVVLCVLVVVRNSETNTANSAWRVHLRPRSMRLPALFVVSAACTAAGILLWVVRRGGWGSFTWLNTNYLPLYGRLDSSGRNFPSVYRMLEDFASTFFWQRGLLAWSLAIVVLLLRERPRAVRLRIGTLTALAVVGLLAGLLGNKNWPYHFLTFYLPALMIMSIGFGDLLAGRKSTWLPKRLAWLPALVAVILFATVVRSIVLIVLYGIGHNPPLVLEQIGMLVPISAALAFSLTDLASYAKTRFRVEGLHAPQRLTGIVITAACVIATATAGFVTVASFVLRKTYEASVANVVDVIESQTRPDQSVFALDTTSKGMAWALMKADRPIATRYIYDFYLFQDPDPTIASMRRSLMDQLQANPPELVLIANQSWGPRPDLASIEKFPELWAFLNSHYQLSHFDCQVTALRRDSDVRDDRSPLTTAIQMAEQEVPQRRLTGTSC
jgi:hypothetical protein